MSETNKQNRRGKYCRTADHRRMVGELIRKWKPWLKSTGPKTTAGKVKVFQKAFKGGWRQDAKKIRAFLRDQISALSKII